jgi:hypothetical protein
LFSLDSHLVGNPSLLSDLRRIAAEMKADSSKRLLVRGHSDSMGGTEYKRALSHRWSGEGFRVNGNRTQSYPGAEHNVVSLVKVKVSGRGNAFSGIFENVRQRTRSNVICLSGGSPEESEVFSSSGH